MKEDIWKIDNIDAYNKMFGVETLHPQVTVVDIHDLPAEMNGTTHVYGLYALFLKQGEGCSARYGREVYDFQEGTVVSFSPGHTVQVFWNEQLPMPPSLALLFHPHLIHGTPLGKRIREYTFLTYNQREALHLSEREQAIVREIIERIRHELQHTVDCHSQTLICDSIGLLLDYCMRYYDRQFITRHKVDSDIFSAFEQQLTEFVESGEAEEKGLPTVAYFAQKAHLSSGYFGDLIKKESGQTAQRYIQDRVMDYAKHYIAEGSMTVNEIAWKLGFQYPQHFTRMFKQSTGLTPRAYRHSIA